MRLHKGCIISQGGTHSHLSHTKQQRINRASTHFNWAMTTKKFPACFSANSLIVRFESN